MESKRVLELKNYIQRGIYPKRIRKSETRKRNFRRDCKKFKVRNGVLFFSSKGKELRVVAEKEKFDILQNIHAQPHGGHLGINKTWQKLRSRYYWAGSFKDVKNFVSKCDTCQRKEQLKKAKKPLRPIAVPDNAFSQIGMDLIGPLEETKTGNRYVAVLTDYLTKWVEAEGIPDKSAQSVMSVFIKFVCAHGVPNILITDQGREFCNEINDAFCERMGIEHRVATAYHPQTCGHTERFNRTLCTMLANVVNSKSDDWDEQIPMVLFAYRTAKHDSTKMDPFSLVYGRQARLPVELDLPVTDSSSANIEDEDLVLKRRAEAFLIVSEQRKIAKKRINDAQKKQKKYHDRGVSKERFKKGEIVLLHNTRKVSRKGGKLEKKWLGPYQISNVKVQKNGVCVYNLNGLKGAVNEGRLKKYRSSDDKCTEESSDDTILYYKEESQGPCKDSPEDEENKSFRTFVSSDDEKPFAKQTSSNSEKEVRKPPEKFKDESNGDEDSVTCTVRESDSSQHLFVCVGSKWQIQHVKKGFGVNVKNMHGQSRIHEMANDAKPSKVVPMRGDGNCLFRALSYILFGSQTYHVIVRDYLLEYMKSHDAEFSSIAEKRSVNQYIEHSKMGKVGTWGTEVEIFAFATMMDTCVYVYCQQGTCNNLPKMGWSCYSPIGKPSRVSSECHVYLQNVHAHFEPVFEVECKNDGTCFRKQPYFALKNFLPEKYHQYFSKELLDASLVDNHADEEILQNTGSYKTIYVKPFTSKAYDIPGMIEMAREMDANIFNILCDHGDFEIKAVSRSKYD